MEVLQQASLKKPDIVFFVSLVFYHCAHLQKFVLETSLVAYDDLGTSNFFHDFSRFYHVFDFFLAF